MWKKGDLLHICGFTFPKLNFGLKVEFLSSTNVEGILKNREAVKDTSHAFDPMRVEGDGVLRARDQTQCLSLQQ